VLAWGVLAAATALSRSALQSASAAAEQATTEPILSTKAAPPSLLAAAVNPANSRNAATPDNPRLPSLASKAGEPLLSFRRAGSAVVLWRIRPRSAGAAAASPGQSDECAASQRRRARFQRRNSRSSSAAKNTRSWVLLASLRLERFKKAGTSGATRAGPSAPVAATACVHVGRSPSGASAGGASAGASRAPRSIPGGRCGCPGPFLLHFSPFASPSVGETVKIRGEESPRGFSSPCTAGKQAPRGGSAYSQAQPCRGASPGSGWGGGGKRVS